MNPDILSAGETSVGVVSPFAGQARMIRELMSDPDDPAAQFVTVATAHRFQGGERNVMVFSTVIDPQMPIATLRWIENNRNLINVAASRARRMLYVVGHPGIAHMAELPTLRSLRSRKSVAALLQERPERRVPDLVARRRHVETIGDQQVRIRLAVGAEHLLLDVHVHEVRMLRRVVPDPGVRRANRVNPLPAPDARLDRNKNDRRVRQVRLETWNLSQRVRVSVAHSSASKCAIESGSTPG